MQRRHFLATVGTGAASVGAIPWSALSTDEASAAYPRAVTGPSIPEMDSFDTEITNLMDKWTVPGGAVGVVKNGRLVFAHGYGHADTDSERLVQPDTRFRVASLSKAVTSATVLRLVDQGQLSLDETAFSILSHLLPDDGSYDSRLDDVTIRMLLRHTAGWDRDTTFDPMFRTVSIAHEMGVTPPAGPETIIRYMTDRDLSFDPGTEYAYSNFGYCVLGRIVEEVTGEPYESHVVDTVLPEMGIYGMQLGHTREGDRAVGEPTYYHWNGETTGSVFPNEGTVPWPYGGFYLEAMDAHGGWIASTMDYLRFVAHVDGRTPPDDALSASAVDSMTAEPPVPAWDGTSYHYGMGWLVRPSAPNWWHSGSLPGTMAFVVRAEYENAAWVALFNTRPEDWGTFQGELDTALWDAARAVSNWPSHDLFDRYGVGNFDADDDGRIDYDELREANRQYNEGSVDRTAYRRALRAYNAGLRGT
jgi:CubicO group peptidase (beta-lactamase class C family)